MPISARSARRPPLDIWPGFVDALASLLILVIFVLMIFMVAQFYLSDALSGRDKALLQLNRRIQELTEMLSLERGKSTGLDRTLKEIAAELRATLAARDRALARARRLAGAVGADKRALAAEKRISASARAQLEILNSQLAALRNQLAAIEAALKVSEAKAVNQELKIADLGKRLNVALALKVRELSRYRSEFFGRLREVLGTRDDIRIVGDRFVFQSEVLFPSGEAELQEGGKVELAKLAATLKEISEKVPKQIDWVLRIDGHTDKRKIRAGAKYASNWELSQARALAVVKQLIEQGIPPQRLAPTGFGEFHPLDPGTSDAAYRKNRRIELKFTQR
ncbi:MAG TPA: peptidoglycan -binding protein [Alphaproteobacteria bacterium]|nr:peptidoglycan -binding protein [Alphaproteobacteria bacterium]